MKLRAQIFLGFMLIFGFMAIMAAVSLQNTRTLLNMQDDFKVAQAQKQLAREIPAAILGMQSAKRGYLLTGEALYRDSYRDRQHRYQIDLLKLKTLIAHEPEKAIQLSHIERLTERWIDSNYHEIEIRDKIGADPSPFAALVERIQKEEQPPSVFAELQSTLQIYLEAEDRELRQRDSAAVELARTARATTIGGTLLAMVLGIGVMLYVTRRTLQQVGGEPGIIATAAEQIALGNLEVHLSGKTGIAASVAQMVAILKEVTQRANTIAAGDYSEDIAPRSEKDKLGLALQTMTRMLRNTHAENLAQNRLKTGIARLNDALLGDPTLEVLAARAISEIATGLNAQVGTFYLLQESHPPTLILIGSYAYRQRKNLSNTFALGEGLVGQAALERQQIVIHQVPEDYIRVVSGLGEQVPRFICVTPFLYENRLKGVVEIGLLGEITPIQLEYLSQAMSLIAIAVESAQARATQRLLLERSRSLAEELQTQQEELRTTNEELEQQSQQLQASEERLRVQQEALELSNNELQQKNTLLERQKREVEQARQAIAVKAEELAVASRYKSEFLANMSHELRTPLNSLLLLAQSLMQNKNGNLTPDQLESAQIIHSSGSDLLNLINEILDLSKIEAGRMDIQIARLLVADLAESVRTNFTHMAQAKGLSLEVVVDPDAPRELSSDLKRLEQVIRNLISNAIKFTESGGIQVRFGCPSAAIDLSRSGLTADHSLAIAVEDSGIGIEKEKHRVIFEAFQQADGSTSRRFGGTGLGLTISRELMSLLGGEIQLVSELGQGSTFTLYLPIQTTARPVPHSAIDKATSVPERHRPAVALLPAPTPHPVKAQPYIIDDRDHLTAGSKLIVVIEDDPKFAAILVDKCHEKGFQCLVTAEGEAGLNLIHTYLPTAIILDIHLPGINGMAVLAALKDNLHTRHIPVYIVSIEEHATESLRRGAIGHEVKPIDQDRMEGVFQRLEAVVALKPRRVLVIEDEEQARQAIVKLISDNDVEVDEAISGEQAIGQIQSNSYDCIVLDLKLPDMDGQTLLERLTHEGTRLPPVIIHTAYDLTHQEEIGLREHADSIVIKDVRSLERLLDEVSLFLHRVVSQMPEPKRQIIRDLYDTDALLRNKKVLIVDDDMRTLFALSRLLLEHGVEPIKAENGQLALQLLADHPDVDLVLMDVMMPVMDGYETIRRIRQQERYRKLPIISLTAKAMPEDRQKCIASGASDYLTKPIDTDRLFSMMRVWLYG